MKLLAHHVSVIQSAEFMEELKGYTTDKRRSPEKVAAGIVKSLAGQKRYASMLADEQNSQAFQGVFSKAIAAHRADEIEEVRDFQVKRDEICEACGVTDCWRKNDSLSLAVAISRIRQSLK